MNKIKGYKAMNKDMTCREFKFKVGNEYKTPGLSMCGEGFHFCENLLNVYAYYPKTIDTVVCEVEALGDCLKEGDKSATNHIKIVKQLSETELLAAFMAETNAGNRNAGTGNAGNRNAGHDNAGHYNAGNRNAGTGNAGTGNAGNYNAGTGNAGNRNAGNYNAGHDNAGTGNAGMFNLAVRTVMLFDKDSGLEWESDIIKTLKNKLNKSVKPILRWVSINDMSEAEKSEFPSSKTTGGFLRNMKRSDYSALNNPSDIAFFQALPNFDAETFFAITGIDTQKPKTVKVTCNGQEIEIDLDKAKELGLIK